MKGKPCHLSLGPLAEDLAEWELAFTVLYQPMWNDTAVGAVLTKNAVLLL